MLVECSKPALDKLERAGLLGKILEKKSVWHLIDIGGGFNSDFYDFLDTAENFLRTADFSKKSRNAIALYSSLMELKNEVDGNEFLDKTEALLRHPSALAYLNIGEDVLNYREYGFESRRQLEETITSFCLSDHESDIIKDSYLWLHGNYKNRMTNGYHGDCHIFQTNISGKYSIEQTLFGEEEVFDTMKILEDDDKRGIWAHYDAWDNWLMAILRYAEALGKKDIPEIVNWKDVVNEVGVAGTITTEAMFGESHHILFHLTDPIMIEGQKPEKLPLAVYGDNQKNYIPYVKDRKLLFLIEHEQGSIDFSGYGGIFEGKRFRPELVYEESELVHLLKGTYRLYARDRSKMPKIIKLFSLGCPENYYI
jgi:hypothetical protein